MTMSEDYQPLPPDRRQAAHVIVPVPDECELPARLNDAIAMVIAENHSALTQIDCALLERVGSTVRHATRIFVAGEGRSGLAVRMVAMRLMHLGCKVHVIGETTTPSIKAGDVLIAFSGSGSTGVVSLIAERARAAGALVVAVTTQPKSPLGQLANQVLTISAASKHDQSSSRSRQFAGSLFEQSALLLFDALFHVLSSSSQQDHDQLWARHTNLE